MQRKYVFKSQERRSPKATDWTIWPSNPDKNKTFVSAAKWGTISLLFNGYKAVFSTGKAGDLRLITHLHLMTCLRTSGIITPFSLYVFMVCTGPILPYLFTNMCVCSHFLVFTVFQRGVPRRRDVLSK
jgi:hypothetical protein